MGNDDLLAETVITVGATTLALAAPHADERQQREQGVVEVRAFAKIGGIGRRRKVGEARDVAGGGCFRAFGGGRDRVVA